jgi:uncharacterized protein (TIGR02996 family)
VSVHFVYRCHYGNPNEKFSRHFPADTVLDWFRSIWRPIASQDEAYDFAGELIGCNVYSFSSLFTSIAEGGWPPPTNMRRLRDCLEDSLYVNEMNAGKNHVQIYTDDDDLEMVIHIFDDHYTAAHPERAAFLLHDDWKLPDGAGDGSFRTSAATRALARVRGGKGRTYLPILGFYASDNIDALAYSYRLDGLRLPDLARFLLCTELDEDNWPGELFDLSEELRRLVAGGTGDERAFLARIQEQPADQLTWDVYSDWLQEHDRPRAGAYLLEQAMRASPPGHVGRNRNPDLDLFHVGTHLAQTCKHVATSERTGPEYHQWIFFDDLWASAQPHLANSLLRFASRWDVL